MISVDNNGYYRIRLGVMGMVSGLETLGFRISTILRSPASCENLTIICYSE